MTYRNPGTIEFDAVIRQDEQSGPGTWVEFPHSVEELYGVRGRVPVSVTIDGLPYTGSMVRMGTACHLVPVLAEIRRRLGKATGDTVRVTVELDQAPRVVVLAEDAAAALAASSAAERAWSELSYSHRREYHRWIEEAKRPETRARRIAGMVERLESGRRLG